MSLFSFKCVLIVHIRPEFYENVNTSASETLQTSYDHYKCLANDKNDLRLVTNMLGWLRICCEYAFIANFRSMFLIFVNLKSSANAYESL